MCFQGYVHYLCGHTSLYEEECSTATSLGLPFFLKVSCPTFEITRRSPSRSCGTGTFYCAQTPDGQYLDRVYAVLSTVQSDIQNLECRIYGPKGLKRYGQSLGNAVLNAGGSREECQNDAGVREVWATVGQLGREIEALRYRQQAMLTTIEKAKSWFEAARARFGMDVKGPSELLRPQGLYPPPLQQQQRRLSQRPLARLAAGWSMPAGQMTMPMGQYRPAQAQAQARRVSQTVPKKRGPQKTEVSSPEKVPTPLPTRRSSRVRTKKISYTDSDSADPSSRTPSPAKSEAGDSNFSPTKAKVSLPTGRQARAARSSSLVEMIGEWKKGHGNALRVERKKHATVQPSGGSAPQSQKRSSSTTAQPLRGSQQTPVLTATTKRVWYGDSEPQKRSLPPSSADDVSSGNNKRMKISFLTNLGSVITGEESTSTTGAPLAPKIQAKVEEAVPLLKEDDSKVESEGDSTLSEIDWDVLEEGVLEDRLNDGA